ncbi:hypothetical protein D4Z93_11655 [Clostridium fermenticellae]|uniref:Lipoprotein n=1 Tax=Clostridium fermenticellae TaxID=2068654 RepID=A0A386H5Z8_9CLOT|nr:hypothetical protein [Clostridium fermenticellae]AYD41139.1 hypothetical protein D4Z93_11655 [Clostridium fermenticellae]
MRRALKKLVLFFVTAAMLASLAGCSFGKSSQVQPNKDPKKVVQDAKLTQSLKKEKGVSNGQVYVQNKTAVAAIVLKKDVSKKDAEALANKYADDLKKYYKDLKINVQAVQNNKNVVNISK